MFRSIILLIFLFLIQSQYSAAESQDTTNANQQNSPQMTVIQSGETGQTGNNTQTNQTYADKWFEPIVILTLFLFVGVLTQSAIYTWQAILMRRSVNQTKSIVRAAQRQALAAEKNLRQAREHFELTERPILVAIEGYAAITPTQPIMPGVKIINKGRTAAINLTIFLELYKPDNPYVCPNPLTEPIEVPFLGAGDDMWISAVPDSNRILTQDEVDAILKKQKRFLFIYGYGIYQDMAEKTYPLERWAFTLRKHTGWEPDYTIVSLWKANKEWEDQKQADKNQRQNPN